MHLKRATPTPRARPNGRVERPHWSRSYTLMNTTLQQRIAHSRFWTCKIGTEWPMHCHWLNGIAKSECSQSHKFFVNILVTRLRNQYVSCELYSSTCVPRSQSSDRYQDWAPHRYCKTTPGLLCTNTILQDELQDDTTTSLDHNITDMLQCQTTGLR